MTSFITKLKEEIQTNSLVLKINSTRYESFLLLDTLSEPPQLVLLVNEDNQVTRWIYQLTDRNILNHMENDIGIYDSDGLEAFACYFIDSLLDNIKIDANIESNLSSKSEINLYLSYKIGSIVIEGGLKFEKTTNQLDLQYFTFVKAAYNSHFSIAQCKERSSSKGSTLKELKLVSQASESKTASLSLTQSEIDEVEDWPESNAPLKAKRKRVGGVNLFAKKR